MTKHGLNINLKHKNKNPLRERKLYSDEIMCNIHKVCAPDIELYDYACSILNQEKPL